jgi:hypothetical protein
MSERVPAYSRQKESGRSDRAYVRIDGRKISLGRWNSAESKAKYARLIGGEDPEPTGPPVTVEDLLSKFLDYIDQYYGRGTNNWKKYRLVMRVLREHFADLPFKDFRGPQLKELQQIFVKLGRERRYINKLPVTAVCNRRSALPVVRRRRAWR